MIEPFIKTSYVCPCGKTFWSIRSKKSPKPKKPPALCEECRFKTQRERMGKGKGTKGPGRMGRNEVWPPLA